MDKEITLADTLKIHKLFYEKLMQEFAMELSNPKQLHPIEHAAIIHNRLVTIHPFVDGNGRAVRLLMNLLLLKAGYSITIIPPVFRSDYIKCAYEGNKGHHQEFINFLSSMVYESQKEMLRLLKDG